MISKITITNSNDLPINYWNRNAALNAINELNFRSGINILCGKNGSGKSSILKLIAKMFHADQGGISTITASSIHSVIPVGQKYLHSGLKIDHDGQGIIYFDPSRQVGISGSNFDDDFLNDGIDYVVNKGSSGELSQRNILKSFIKGKDKKYLKPIYRVSKENTNSIWSDKIIQIENFFAARSMPENQITIVLDEPDRSLDITTQQLFWQKLTRPELLEQKQIIIASHSIFSIAVRNANYIELTANHIDECRKVVANFQ